MESICNFLEKLFSPKEQEKVKQTPKIQSTAYPDGTRWDKFKIYT